MDKKDKLTKWLKLLKKRHTELGTKIENFDLGDTTMAYLSLGNAIDKVIELFDNKTDSA